MLGGNKESLETEVSILDELQETESKMDWMSNIGIIMIIGSGYVPILFPAFGTYMWIVMIIGFIFLLAPSILIYKELANKMYFGSETYIGDDDIYEQFAVTDIITVSAASEPFPFAEYCYEEDDITEFIDAIGGKALVEPDEIKAKIESEIKKRAEEFEFEPSIKEALRHKWRKFRKKDDKEEFHLKEDVEDDIND